MAWFSRFTRYGDMHIVYGQEKDNSCGMASIMMTFFKMNKLTPGSQAVYAEERVIKTYEQVKGATHDFERNGAVDNLVLNTMNKLDGNQWKYKYKAGGKGMGALVAKEVGLTGGFGPTLFVTPVMIGITWLGSNSGHWAVVDTVRTGFLGGMTATVCDPWDTNVHMQDFTSGGVFSYHPGEGGFMVSFGGTHKGMSSPYDKTSAGVVDAIIYKG